MTQARLGPLGEIERIGRHLAAAIASEFAADQTARVSGDPPATLTDPGAPDELAGELIDWIDFMSDLARESVFSMSTLGDSRSAGATGLFAEISKRPGLDMPSGEPAEFWLHSASGSAEVVSPIVEPLLNDEGDSLVVRVKPPSATVDETGPARFELQPTELASVPAGVYHGRIRAAGVAGALPVVVMVTE